MIRRMPVVTGIGVIAPNGIGKEDFWDALKSGRCGIKDISSFDASALPVRIAGEVRGFNPLDFMDRKHARRMARFSQFAVACARMAIRDAGLDTDIMKKKSSGVVMGIASTDLGIVERESLSFNSRGLKRVNPLSSFISLPNAASGEISGDLNIEGLSLTVSTGCASGVDALGNACRIIQRGDADIVVAGGSDCPITPVMLATLCAASIMSTIENPEKASRPFDKLRAGGVLAEGAAVLVIEERGFAIARGAKIYGELAGYGQSMESRADNPGDGLKRAIRRCFDDAGTTVERVGYVSAHAPSDVLLDRCETEVLKSVFGRSIYRVPVSSIKGHIGNPYSAAGVMQVISVILGMADGVVVPTINYEFPDPECDLDYVPRLPRFNEIEMALVNSHGFGGANSALLVRSPE